MIQGEEAYPIRVIKVPDGDDVITNDLQGFPQRVTTKDGFPVFYDHRQKLNVSFGVDVLFLPALENMFKKVGINR